MWWSPRTCGARCARAIYTEVNARMQLQAVTLGGPITFIDPEEAKLSEDSRGTQSAGQGIDAHLARCGSKKHCRAAESGRADGRSRFFKSG